MRRIDLRKKPRRLETISVGDVLVFPKREETVIQVNTSNGMLCTKKIVKIANRDFPYEEQLMLYKHRGTIDSSAIGTIYYWAKVTSMTA